MGEAFWIFGLQVPTRSSKGSDEKNLLIKGHLDGRTVGQEDVFGVKPGGLGVFFGVTHNGPDEDRVDVSLVWGSLQPGQVELTRIEQVFPGERKRIRFGQNGILRVTHSVNEDR